MVLSITVNNFSYPSGSSHSKAAMQLPAQNSPHVASHWTVCSTSCPFLVANFLHVLLNLWPEEDPSSNSIECYPVVSFSSLANNGNARVPGPAPIPFPYPRHGKHHEATATSWMQMGMSPSHHLRPQATLLFGSFVFHLPPTHSILTQVRPQTLRVPTPCSDPKGSAGTSSMCTS